MINTSIKYIVYNHSGSGVRHHDFTTSNNIVEEADGHASTGDALSALGFPSLPFMGVNLPFAFMSVHGAADGNHLYTEPGNQLIPVGNTDIDVLVVYAPAGGIGSGGGPGIWVDAFNVDTGKFSDAKFIQVLTPPTPPDSLDNPKTAWANAEGDIPTVNAEDIRAFASIDAGASFVEWKKIVPLPATSNNREVDLAQNETGEIWFAFYQAIPPSKAISDLNHKLEQTMGKWINDDQCGTPVPHHIGPNFQISLPRDVVAKLSPAQRDKLDALNKEYHTVANAGYTAMGGVQDTLKRVSQLISETKGG